MKDFNFPVVNNISPKTLAQDIVPVFPIEEGKSVFHIVVKHEHEEEVYDKIIGEANIAKYRELFKTKNILVGDNIETWDDGGWLQLAGRAGLQLVRNGSVIKKILTRMS